MFQIGKGDALRARRFLAKHGDELAFELVDHKEADYLGKPGEATSRRSPTSRSSTSSAQLLERERKHPHRLADLAVDGDDLIELGFKPGPELGHVLRDLLREVVDDPAQNTPRPRSLRRARAKLRT